MNLGNQQTFVEYIRNYDVTLIENARKLVYFVSRKKHEIERTPLDMFTNRLRFCEMLKQLDLELVNKRGKCNYSDAVNHEIELVELHLHEIIRYLTSDLKQTKNGITTED